MRLINADAIMPRLRSISEAERQIYGEASWGFAQKCIAVVEDAPTVKSEIIHCKDCKYLEEDTVFHEPWCRGNRVFVSGDHYCGYAVRRSDERLN